MNCARVLFFLALCLWLSGCATMTPNECKSANWAEVGLRDGLDGAALSRLDSRVKDCVEASVPVDTPRYLQGRDQGLLQYCRIENAVPLGLNGKSYEGVCPAAMDAEFRRRFKVGRDVHVARNELRSLESRRGTAEERLRSAANDEDRRRARDRVRDAEWVLDRLR